jgi:hypothetical protein
MGMFSKQGWKDWAREWGLIYHAPRFLGSTREWMVGSYRGYLVKAGWLGDRHLEFYVLIRFPKLLDPAVVRQRLLEDVTLAALPGWSKIKPADLSKRPALLAVPNGGAVQIARTSAVGAKPLLVDDSSILWTRPCPWRRPGAEQLEGWVEKLIVALSQMARGFEGRCEQCGRTLGQRFIVVNGVPVHLCETCQADLVQKGRMAEQAYDERDARHALGAIYATVAALVGGAVWALIAFLTQHMFALTAIGIAVLVGFAYRLGARKMDLAGQAIGVALTLAGVLFGDVLFFAALVMQRWPRAGLRIEAGWAVFVSALKAAPADILFSLLFGLLGAIYVVRMLARPRFAPKIEADDQKQAAA